MQVCFGILVLVFMWFVRLVVCLLLSILSHWSDLLGPWIDGFFSKNTGVLDPSVLILPCGFQFCSRTVAKRLWMFIFTKLVTLACFLTSTWNCFMFRIKRGRVAVPMMFPCDKMSSTPACTYQVTWTVNPCKGNTDKRVLDTYTCMCRWTNNRMCPNMCALFGHISHGTQIQNEQDKAMIWKIGIGPTPIFTLSPWFRR